MTVKLSNNAEGKLTSSITTTATTLYLQSGQGVMFPALANGDWFPLTLVKADGSYEIVKVTARTGDALTVVRAQEGTAARAFAAGDKAELRLTAAAIAEIVAIANSVNSAQQSLSSSLGNLATRSGSEFFLGLLSGKNATEFRAAIGLGSLPGADVSQGSLPPEKLTRAAINKVLVATGENSDPEWGEMPFAAISVPDGGIKKRSISNTAIQKVQAFPKRQRGDCTYAQCVVQMSDNVIKGWGRTGNLKLGINHTDDSTAPPMRAQFNVPPPEGVTIKEVAGSGVTMFVLLSNGWVYSCGLNASGVLGQGDLLDRSILTRIEYFITNNIVVSKVFASGSRNSPENGQAFFITDGGAVYAAGYNGYGQLGTGDTANKSTPTMISGGISGVSHVALSGSYIGHTFLLKSDGKLYAAGYNGQGQLGLGDNANRNTFTLVPVSDVAQIDCVSGWNNGSSSYSGCSVLRTTSGDVYTAGHNAYGQLGQGDTAARNAFTKVGSLANIANIGVSGGFYGHMWAVDGGGRLFCWGYNSQGVIGDGTTTNRTSPFNVTGWSGNPAQDPPFLGKIVKIEPHHTAQGQQHLVVLDSDGNLWFAGHDYGFYCGDTAVQRNRFTPFIPANLANVGEKIVDIHTHGTDAAYRLFALTNEQNLYAVGDNSYGVCTGGYTTSPAFVKSLQKIML